MESHQYFEGLATCQEGDCDCMPPCLECGAAFGSYYHQQWLLSPTLDLTALDGGESHESF